MKKYFFYLTLIVLGAAVYRLGYLLAPHMDSDQAVFGLAGWRVQFGEFPIFQWNFHYMGTLQSYLDLIPFTLFGLNRYSLNSVPLVLSLVFIVLTYFFVKELLQNKSAGLVAAIIAAFGPYFLVLHGAWARHGYLETMIFGTLLLLLTTRIVYQDPTPKQKKKYFLWLGFIAGVAWWTNFLSLYYFAACGLFLLWHDKKLFLRKEFYLATGLFVIGSLPFWIYNVIHDFASLSIFFKKADVNLWKNILAFFQYKLPVILGVRENAPFFWKIFSLSFFVLTTLWLCTRKHPKALWIPLFLFLLIIYLQSSSFYGKENTERHLLPLYSIIPLFLARAYQTLKEKSQWLSLSFLVILLAIFIQDNSLSHPFWHPERIKRFREDQATKQKMKKTLLEKEIRGAYTYSYWVGPVMTFDCAEEVLFPHPFLDRYPTYTRKTDALWNPAYLTVGGSKKLEETFNALNIEFKRFNAAPFDFYSFFKRKGTQSEQIPPLDWNVSTSSNRKKAHYATDQNLRSVWLSDSAQTPGMNFVIQLAKPEKVNKLEIYTGTATKGVPGQIKLLRSLNGKDWEEVKNLAPYRGFFWDGTHPFDHGIYDRREINLDGALTRFLKLELAEPKKIEPHYWALAEVCLYRQIDTPYSNLQKEQIETLVEKLTTYKEHKIFPTIWLSAYLAENHPKLNVANIWEAPIKKKVLEARILTLEVPTLLIAPKETENSIKQVLSKSKIAFTLEQSPPFSLFKIKPAKDPQRWYWSGKHLFHWNRIKEAS